MLRSTPDATLGATPLPGRRELALVLLIVACDAVLRLALPARMAVEHFDEGVYASNIWFEEGRYPARHLYAPPLLPALIEWSIILFGPDRLGPMLVNIVAGTLTIALLWWVGRQWFGPEAGLAAASLGSLSDFHLLYSRTALTDPLLGFWLLLAVYLAWECCRRRSLPWIVAAGVAAGLAWWTKYNGWLPLAVGAAGLAAFLFAERIQGRRHSAGRLVICWAGVAAIAAAVWSPVLIGLQPYGGYSVVAANHRGYLVGPADWPDSLLRQVANLRYLEGPLTWGGLAVALVFACFARAAADFDAGGHLPAEQARRSGTPQGGWAWFLLPAGAAVLLAGAAAFAGAPLVLGVLAAAGIAVHVRQRLSGRGGHESNGNRSLAAWLLAAWFCGLLVATPFYRPYPRLALPWLIAAWLGTGAAIGWSLRRLRSASPARGAPAIDTKRAENREGEAPAEPQANVEDPLRESRRDSRSESPALKAGATAAAASLLVGIALMAAAAQRSPEPRVPGWQDRTAIESVAESFARSARDVALEQRGGPADQVIVYTFGEPAILFHLRAAEILAGPVTDLRFAAPNAPAAPVPTFLVVGPHARRSREFAEQWSRYGEAFQLVASTVAAPSDLVLLDEHDPRVLADGQTLPRDEFHLFLLDRR